MEKIKMTKLEKEWSLYDAGNSAFILLVTSILPIYFKNLASKAGVSDTDYLALWGYTASVVTVIVMILGPIVGSIADGKDMKKRMFLITVLIGVIANMLFAVPMHYIAFLVLFILAKIGFQLSLVVYDSMLTDVTTNDRMDTVSSMGYALGYIYSCIPFIASIALIFFSDKIGISTLVATGIGFIVIATWWLIFTIPLLKSYKQVYFTKAQSSLSQTFITLKDSIIEIKNNKKVLLFLVAFFFYIDGVYTIISMSVAYGSSLGLDSNGLLLALLVTQVIAFPSVLIFGKLSLKIKTSTLVTICIFAYFLITLFAIWLDTLTKFWILAVFVGLFQGAIQALSRSYFGKIIPEEKSGKYFAIYDIFGKSSAFVGTFLVSFISQITGKQYLGITVLPVLLLLGLLFFILADKKQA